MQVKNIHVCKTNDLERSEVPTPFIWGFWSSEMLRSVAGNLYIPTFRRSYTPLKCWKSAITPWVGYGGSDRDELLHGIPNFEDESSTLVGNVLC